MANKDLKKLIEDVGFLLSPREIEDAIQDTKKYFKSQQYSKIENNDFRSFGELLQKHGRIGANNLGMLENVVAPSSSQRQEIEKLIEEFKSNVSKDDIPEKFVGRENDIEKIMKRLENHRVKAVGLFGSPGVGKTTLAFEAAKRFCRSRDDGTFERVDVDLKGTTNLVSLIFLVLQAFGVNTIAYELEVIRQHVNTMEKKALVLLDNVEQFVTRSRRQEHNENFIKLLEIMMSSDKIKLLLTSREKIDEPSLRRFGLSEFEVEPLSDKMSTDMVKQTLGSPVHSLSAETLSKVVKLSGNKPLFIQGLLPIIKAEIKNLEDVVHDIEEKLQNEETITEADFAGKEIFSKNKEDICFQEMFETLTPEQRQDAIKLSLFRRAFTVTDAGKLLEKTSSYSLNLALETLKSANILDIHDSTDKSAERSYEIHPRLLEFFGNLKKAPGYAKDFAKAEELFYKLFSEKILKLSESIETDFVTAYNEVQKQRPNFELTLEIAMGQRKLSLFHSDADLETDFIFILFEAMFNVGERRHFYQRWSNFAKEIDEQLVSGKLKCWEAELVILLEGPTKAMEVLDDARQCLDKTKPLLSRGSCDVVESLYSYVRGKILEKLERYEEALKVLKDSLKIRKTVFKEHILTARTMNAIGNCLQHLERYDEAQSYYYKAKEMRRELTGSDKHFDMPVYYNQLATIHEVKGRNLKYSVKTRVACELANKEFQASIDWYQKALDLEAELGVQGSQNTAIYYRNMANTYMHLEEYDKAFETASKALEIRIKIFKKHLDVAKSLYQVGITLEWRAQETNKDPELLRQALKYYEEAKRILQTLPEDNRGQQKLQQIEIRCREVAEILLEYEKRKSSQEFRDSRRGRSDSQETVLILKCSEDEDSTSDVETEGRFKIPGELFAKSKERLSTAVDVREEEQIKEPAVVEKRTIIESRTVTLHSCEWTVDTLGIHFKFPEKSVDSITRFNLFQWSRESCPVPLYENEAVASCIVELVSVGKPKDGFAFKKPVKLVLSHGASNVRGYEVVIRKLVRQTQTWEDLETRDFWSPKDMESHQECEPPRKYPGYYFPVAETEISECSIFAVVYRLCTQEANISSRGGIIVSNEFRSISLDFPKHAIPSNSTLRFKVQETRCLSPMAQERSTGITPILHFECSSDLQLKKPVSVTIPYKNATDEADSTQPDIDSSRVKVFIRKEDSTGEQVWVEEKMQCSPILKKEVVQLQLTSFPISFSIWIWVGFGDATTVASFYSRLAAPKIPPAFAVYPDFPKYIQSVVCLLMGQTEESIRNFLRNENVPLNTTDGRRYYRISKDQRDGSSSDSTKQSKSPAAEISTTRKKVKVITLCDEWASSKGGLSTFNRQLVLHLARQSNLDVCCYLLKFSEEEKEKASKNGVTLIKVKEDSSDALHRLPQDAQDFDILVSHGRKFGSHALTNYSHHSETCSWFHFVHVDYEELAKAKGNENARRESEEKHNKEVDFCEKASQVVAVGSLLQLRYQKFLSKEAIQVHCFTPGLSEEFQNLKLSTTDTGQFDVFVFGRLSSEDFELKGFDVAANAVARLDRSYQLYVVGAGAETQDDVCDRFLEKTKIKKNQLTVKSYCTRKEMKTYFCRADVVLMPSRVEAFGLVGLEAISAGIPVLVSSNSGLGNVLKNELPIDTCDCVVESDQPEEWAKQIERLRGKRESERKREANDLRDVYGKKFCWDKECSELAKLFNGEK